MRVTAGRSNRRSPPAAIRLQCPPSARVDLCRGAVQQYDQSWANELKDLLLEMRAATEQARSNINALILGSLKYTKAQGHDGRHWATFMGARMPWVTTLHYVFKWLAVSAFEAELQTWAAQTLEANTQQLVRAGKAPRRIHGEELPGGAKWRCMLRKPAWGIGAKGGSGPKRSRRRRRRTVPRPSRRQR